MKYNCISWRDCGHKHGGECATGVYLFPSFGTCDRCKARESIPGFVEPTPVTITDQPRAADSAAKIRRKGIGDHVKDIIRDRWGAMPCGACAADIASLNTMTPEQAIAEAPVFAARMALRWEQLPKWWQRLAATAATGNPLTRPLVERHIIAAIEEAVERHSQASSHAEP